MARSVVGSASQSRFIWGPPARFPDLGPKKGYPLPRNLVPGVSGGGVLPKRDPWFPGKDRVKFLVASRHFLIGLGFFLLEKSTSVGCTGSMLSQLLGLSGFGFPERMPKPATDQLGLADRVEFRYMRNSTKVSAFVFAFSPFWQALLVKAPKVITFSVWVPKKGKRGCASTAFEPGFDTEGDAQELDLVWGGAVHERLTCCF